MLTDTWLFSAAAVSAAKAKSAIQLSCVTATCIGAGAATSPLLARPAGLTVSRSRARIFHEVYATTKKMKITKTVVIHCAVVEPAL